MPSPPLEQPIYLRNPAPPYPVAARRNGWEGTIRIRVEVRANGTVERVALMASSGHDVLDEAALKTVARWRFAPARLAGQLQAHQEQTAAILARLALPVAEAKPATTTRKKGDKGTPAE